MTEKNPKEILIAEWPEIQSLIKYYNQVTRVEDNLVDFERKMGIGYNTYEIIDTNILLPKDYFPDNPGACKKCWESIKKDYIFSKLKELKDRGIEAIIKVQKIPYSGPVYGSSKASIAYKGLPVRMMRKK